LIAESGINAVSNPLINLTLQGRHDTHPRRRGMTRVAEMRALGIPAALGQDCVMDPWYGLGGADMLDVAHMAVHGAPVTGREAIRWTFDAVTEIPARILGLEGYGIAVGANADMVLLQAADLIEAVRLRDASLRHPSRRSRCSHSGERDRAVARGQTLESGSGLIRAAVRRLKHAQTVSEWRFTR